MQKELDREQKYSYDDIVVKVTSDPDYSTSTSIPFDHDDDTLLQVIVTVLDENDNGPIFLKKLYTGGKYNQLMDISRVMTVDCSGTGNG